MRTENTPLPPIQAAAPSPPTLSTFLPIPDLVLALMFADEERHVLFRDHVKPASQRLLHLVFRHHGAPCRNVFPERRSQPSQMNGQTQGRQAANARLFSCRPPLAHLFAPTPIFAPTPRTGTSRRLALTVVIFEASYPLPLLRVLGEPGVGRYQDENAAGLHHHVHVAEVFLRVRQPEEGRRLPTGGQSLEHEHTGA